MVFEKRSPSSYQSSVQYFWSWRLCVSGLRLLPCQYYSRNPSFVRGKQKWALWFVAILHWWKWSMYCQVRTHISRILFAVLLVLFQCIISSRCNILLMCQDYLNYWLVIYSHSCCWYQLQVHLIILLQHPYLLSLQPHVISITTKQTRYVRLTVGECSVSRIV